MNDIKIDNKLKQKFHRMRGLAVSTLSQNRAKPENSTKVYDTDANNDNTRKVIHMLCFCLQQARQKLQSNFNGSNTFGTIKISSRQG